MQHADYFEAKEVASDLFFVETMGKAEMPPCVLRALVSAVP